MELNQEDINAAPYNPRNITEKQAKGLLNSIEEYGDLSGITYNKKTQNLVTGHQRYNELKKKYVKLGFFPVMDESLCVKDRFVIYGIDQNNKEHNTSFIIRVVNWDEKKEEMANVIANSHTISGNWDVEALSTMLENFSYEEKSKFNIQTLELDLGISFDPNIDLKLENKEIDVDTLTKNLNTTCPKCGFEFEDDNT